MDRSDRIALLLSIIAVLASYLVTMRVFEGIAHIEDEIAYVWQARVIAGGELTLPTPPSPKSFLVPFVVDYQGQRFGKYPIGWPAVLSFGERFGMRPWINPFFAGLGVWLTYRLGKRTLSATVGLIAAGLTLTSPFFLMNSGSLLSHPFGLALSAGFMLSWLGAFTQPQASKPWLPTLAAAGSLGLLALTRPFTAVAIAVPFGFHGLYIFARGGRSERLRLVIFGLVALAISLLLFVWQYAVTGDPWLNPYELWWAYDKVGFGPGYGHTEGGHSLYQARINTRHSLQVGQFDLFGWGVISWIFLPFGLWAIRRKRPAWLVASVFPSLVIFYLAYWIGSSLLGPRYYYEGLPSLTLLSAAGIAFLAGWPLQSGVPFPNKRGWGRARALLMTALVLLLVTTNLLFYLPMRLNSVFALYGVQQADLDPFLTSSAQEQTPALVIVHPVGKWSEYGSLIEIEDPFLTTPFIFVFSRGDDVNASVAAHFPARKIFHYYTDELYKLYTQPRSEPK